MTALMLYSPFCPICPDVIRKCVEFFTQKSIPLVVRMPTAFEKTRIPGLPGLLVPKELGDFDQSYLLIGSDIPNWLTQMESKLHGS
jgi:hypothetical protein